MNLKAQRAAALKAAQDIVKKAQAEVATSAPTSSRHWHPRPARSKTSTARSSPPTSSPASAPFPAPNRLLVRGQHQERVARASPPASLRWSATTAQGHHHGDIDIPQVISPAVTTPALKPNRLLELLTTKTLDGNEFEYLRQTVRTNNAAVVADNATKPTSVYTFEEASGRARVIAHLSEPFPIRYLSDHDEVTNILGSQMAEDMYRILVSEILAGSGSGEHFTGLDSTSGVQTQAFSTTC